LKNRTYIAIDLKSFYASVECVERGLDPMTTNLVVADESRTEKTICLAVTPALKSFGIPGRPRLFEVIQKVKEINQERLNKAPGRVFTGSSADLNELESSPNLSLDFIAAPPRMAYYIDYSTRIYNIYLKYIAPEDIHVYSIDEVFMDVTSYLGTYKLSAHELARTIIRDVYDTTGITATAGIGTNLYLAKVAMDILAKRAPADKNGIRIAELDEMNYRRLLWNHRPITDFWRVGKGYAKRLEEAGLYTMGDIARCSLGKADEFHNEDLLYNLFGVNAELLIDHAWGWEPCTIADIKAYEPKSRSTGSGQVLHAPHSFREARLIVQEMAELLALDLVEKRLMTDQIHLSVRYDVENLSNKNIRRNYKGEIVKDGYGRSVPKPARGSINLPRHTSSGRMITEAALELYEQITDKNLLVRKISITANNLLDERTVQESETVEQLDFFSDYKAEYKRRKLEEAQLKRERKIQEAALKIKNRFGKNAILKGINLLDGATAIERNRQIGGHRA
jgi:DNA polymerase V